MMTCNMMYDMFCIELCCSDIQYYYDVASVLTSNEVNLLRYVLPDWFTTVQINVLLNSISVLPSLTIFSQYFLQFILRSILPVSSEASPTFGHANAIFSVFLTV